MGNCFSSNDIGNVQGNEGYGNNYGDGQQNIMFNPKISPSTRSKRKTNRNNPIISPSSRPKRCRNNPITSALLGRKQESTSTHENQCLVGHLRLLATAGFIGVAIPAMVVLGFQGHPQFAIAETLQWCAQLELQRIWVNNFGAVRTLRCGEDVLGCNFFKWCYEEGADERDAIIARQRQKIAYIDNALTVWSCLLYTSDVYKRQAASRAATAKLDHVGSVSYTHLAPKMHSLIA
ncbi:hypothetical protein DEO72_LG2g4223 [Vigna unguiculata]|uniref:Uncharacterized protein n=1 Tax=Vigna unguiculata TaxID=3917 RepID=A0A4D6L607_VIGUN|nr:hypothetical protein DEO72_LG2g4223 [Vigna unguiculata]